MRTRTLALLFGAALTLTTVTPAFAGPPWISAEYPSNPFHPDTKGALLLIHTFHHGATMQVPMSGVAEGIVKGRRQTVQLQVKSTYREGVYAVRGDLPRDGNWALVITMNDGNAKASLLASLGRDGEVLTVNVPHDMKDGWIIPRAATPADIDAALKSSVALGNAERNTATGAALGFAGLLLVGAVLRNGRASARARARTA
jgi:hypothetical protein